MTTKIVRGQLIVFTATPKDADGNEVIPSEMNLYLNYKHADGTVSTDEPIAMEQQTDGSWKAEFDTGTADAGAASASIRAVNPPAAQDIKFTLTAVPANPDPTT